MSSFDPTAPEPPTPEPALDPASGRVLDEVAANATVAPITRLVDGWLAKAAPAIPFRRANAVLPAVGAGSDHRASAAVLDVLEAWYGGFGQRVLVQVSSADPWAAELDEQLAARGYAIEAPVDLLVAETQRIVDAGHHATDRLQVGLEQVGDPDRPRLVVDEGVDEAWARRYGAVHGEDDVWRARTEAYGRMLAGLGPAILAGAVVVGGPADGTGSTDAAGAAGEAGVTDVAGVGFVVLERGWAGVYGMGTAPAWRRRGVAGALLGALATEARRRHGTHLYLQVEVDNPGAQALYRGMGFAPSHRYHYRVSAPA